MWGHLAAVPCFWLVGWMVGGNMGMEFRMPAQARSGIVAAGQHRSSIGMHYIVPVMPNIDCFGGMWRRLPRRLADRRDLERTVDTVVMAFGEASVGSGEGAVLTRGRFGAVGADGWQGG